MMQVGMLCAKQHAHTHARTHVLPQTTTQPLDIASGAVTACGYAVPISWS
jgi:hypothetical protein